MQTILLNLDEPKSLLLDNCNQSSIFTFEIVNKDRNIMSLTVLNIASKGTCRVISKVEAKAQIKHAIANVKAGVIKF